ncbi:MAG: AAA family ATPase [Sandaracinaceae bacterium]
MADELPPIAIHTAVHVREHASGRISLVPVFEPTSVAYGTEPEAHTQLSLYLTERLKIDGAIAQAEASIPALPELVHVSVELPRVNLDRQRVRIRMPCAVLPHRRARWVIVLPIAHTVYVSEGEDLEEVVAREATRIARVLGLDDHGMLQLFGAEAERIEALRIEVDRNADAAERGVRLKKDLDRLVERRQSHEVLRQVARRMTSVRGPDPVGIDAVTAQLGALLSGPERRGIALIGDEGVGKTTVLRAWIDQTPGALVYATSGAQLIAGMSGLGQWQERVRRVMRAAETLDAVLWFDDLRDLLGQRGSELDLAGALKPWLEERRVRLVGELTVEAADRFATRHAGLFATMHAVRVPAQDMKAALAALTSATWFAASDVEGKPTLGPLAAEAIVELTDRYLVYRPFVGKAVRFFEELQTFAMRAPERKSVLEREDVYELFSVQSGIPRFLLHDEVAWRESAARAHFRSRVIGQSAAIDRLVETLAVVKAGLAPRDKPLASLLFVGPTGVGKTELSKALAELLFGSEARLVRFDMSELTDPYAVDRLVSGDRNGEGRLTSAVRQQPFSVILFDEIEKAHPSAFDLLLSVLGEARLSDDKGRTAFFHNAILVMTSNVGALHRARSVGIDPSPTDPDERYLRAARERFRPELLGRLDAIVPFASLSRDEMRDVARTLIDAIRRRRGLAELGVELEVSERALEVLVDRGYDVAYGARALRRHLEDEVAAPIARRLAELGSRAEGSRALVRHESDPAPSGPVLARVAVEGGLLVEVVAASKARRASGDAGSALAAGLARRWARAQLELPSVAEMQSRRDYLLAEVSHGQSKKAGPPAEALAELARLEPRLTSIHGALDEIDTIEELVLSAYLAGESTGELDHDLRSAQRSFRTALLDVLLGAKRRHEIALLVQEWDEDGALDHWLGGLLGARHAREWEIGAHVRRSEAPMPSGWPPSRVWGPALDVRDLDAWRGRRKSPTALIVTVRGKEAGSLVGLEAGLLRYLEPKAGAKQSCLLIKILATRALVEADLDHRRAVESPLPFPGERRLIPAHRTVSADEVITQNGATLPFGWDEYWEGFSEIALEQLRALDLRHGDRETLYAGALDIATEDDASEAAT